MRSLWTFYSTQLDGRISWNVFFVLFFLPLHTFNCTDDHFYQQLKPLHCSGSIIHKATIWCECSTKSWLSLLVDHYVVINLRQEGKIISTKETKGASGSNPVWNAPFLFDLPPGDITQLPLLLEFIVMQVQYYILCHNSSSTVGWWTWNVSKVNSPVWTKCLFLSRVVSTLKAPLWAASWLAVAPWRRGRITGRKCAAKDRRRRRAGTSSNQTRSRTDWLCCCCFNSLTCWKCNLKKTLKCAKCVKCTSLLLTERPCSLNRCGKSCGFFISAAFGLFTSLPLWSSALWLPACVLIDCGYLTPPTWYTEIIAVVATSWWVCVGASVHHLKTSEASEYIQKV